MMLFNEKLYKLRKEKNLSQEALAEAVGTTRQAVSKWENGQGFPETEKLLLLSNLFGVSVDYLLKDTQDETTADAQGYYVSREMAQGYLTFQKAWLRRFACGAAVLILTVTAYLQFAYENLTPIVPLLMALFGGFWTLRGLVASDEQPYKVLNREPLLFDAKHLAELRQTTARATHRYATAFIASLVVMILALCFDPELFDTDFSGGVPAYVKIVVAVLALSVPILFYTGTMLESCNLLAKNEEHVQGFWFRLWRKARRKTDELLK